MKLCWLLLTFSLLAPGSYAQNQYDAASIPKDLLPYASAVTRDEVVSAEVKDLDNTVYRRKMVVTVLNKNGDGDASIVVYHNKSRKIRYIRGTVYDAMGKPLSKFSEKNFNDHSTADGFSMFLDLRYKYFQPAVTNYPYTVEYEYEVLSKQSLNIEDWEPDLNGTAVEHSIYQFACKPDLNIRYKELNYPGKVVTGTNAAGMKTYTWEIRNQKALRAEPFSPDPETYRTAVKIVPERFGYEGYTGSFTNWNEMGKWVYDKLLSDRTALSPQTVAAMHSLTDTITDQKLKAKAIYEYMQRKTRYVSIQIGIGGFQPFKAAEVDEFGYGDCKGLVNYTQALLKAVNIDSYYCVVEAGDKLKKSLMPDMASMTQGNHIILCLPFKNDTTWLECTNKDIPFGFLGDFTDDRLVVACTPTGGKLLHTPKYTAKESVQNRKAIVAINAEGELAGNMTTTFEGWQYDNRTTNPGDMQEEIRKSKERYRINNLEIGKLTYKATKSPHPVNQEQMDLTARDYALAENNKIEFMANLAGRNTYIPREVRNRTLNVYIDRGYTDIDEITYQLPAGYKMENAPYHIRIDKPFGSYQASAYMNDQGQVVYKRKLQIIDGTYPKEQYQDLVDLYQAAADADRFKVRTVKAN
ncbi:DUF3857 domain-containing protein [Mucilaginibacter daejeonensis]|uniref:DUF3857 domain-containing protein n=1 Tax=Mucilaginibacter daejeonensis TaxID=398049 RepID=UPI001D17CC8A|nr:DUF3857 domain-containing protein [Mucilaginibacter daejeonensis]UEG54733.1 DUF3857 domain-containing protein [Mucilaginibacter daejeonensis]